MGSGRWKPVAPADRLRVLADLLESSLSNHAAVRRAAEQKLSESIAWPDYALGLLSLVTSQSTRYEKARHAASVHLKNLLRLRWPKPSSDADYLPLPDFECSFIKESILNLLLTASPPIQVQVAESIVAIAAIDFPSRWRSILPSIVSSLGTALHTGDIATTNSLLVAAGSLFFRFRNASDQQGDLDYCIAEFADTLKRVVEFASQRLPDAAATATATNPLELFPVFECFRLSFQIFQSLNSIRMHPTFKAQMANWMSAFLFFLKTFYQPSVEGDGAADLFRAAVCDNLHLFTEKHEKEFGGYMKESVEAVCSLLMARTASSSCAQLTVAGIRFLTAVTEGVHHKLFESPVVMNQIYDGIVVPNLRVRDDDELFEGNWVEYVRRDSEGNRTDTVRRTVCQLLQGLSTNYQDQVAALVSAHVKKMLMLSDRDKNWKEKDAAIYLVIALMQKPGATAGGTPVVDVQSFFKAVIVPELQNPDWHSEPMLKATVLRFLKEFRDQIPKANVLFLLPCVVRFLTHKSNVVHSYSAACIESLLIIMEEVLVPGVNTITRSQCYVAADIDSVAQLIIQNLAAALGFPGSNENPYIIKCLMRVLRVANIDGQAVCGITDRLVLILIQMCNDPKISDFNSYLFEALLAVVGRFGSSALPDKLPTVLVRILRQDIPEFVPYACKILAQLVNVSKSFDQENWNILAILLNSPAWDRPPSVPACLCLLRAFLPRVSNQDDKLLSILSKFVNLLSQVSTTEVAFLILNTLVEDLHHDIMKPCIEKIWLALFCRLETLLPTRWVVKFANSVVVFMSLIVVRYGYDAFESSIGVMEAKESSFTQFIKRFWIPNLALIKGGRDVKLTAIASIELLRGNKLLHGPVDMWGRLLNSTLGQLLRGDIQYAGMGEDSLLKDVVPTDFFSRSCDNFSAKFSGKFGYIINLYVHPQQHLSFLRQLCAQRNINIS